MFKETDCPGSADKKHLVRKGQTYCHKCWSSRGQISRAAKEAVAVDERFAKSAKILEKELDPKKEIRLLTSAIKNGPLLIGGRGASNYGFISYSGKVQLIGKNQMCFGELWSKTKRVDLPIRYFLDWSYRRKNEQSDRYLEWLLNESPWANVYYYKTPDEVREKGQIFDAHFPTKFMMQAVCAIRYAHDQPRVLDAMFQLREKYIPMVSWVLGHVMTREGGIEPLNSSVRIDNNSEMWRGEQYYGNGHKICSSNFLGREEFENLATGTLYEPEKHTLFALGCPKMKGSLEIWGPTYRKFYQRTVLTLEVDPQIHHSIKDARKLKKELLRFAETKKSLIKDEQWNDRYHVFRETTAIKLADRWLADNFGDKEIEKWLL